LEADVPELISVLAVRNELNAGDEGRTADRLDGVSERTRLLMLMTPDTNSKSENKRVLLVIDMVR